MIKMVKIKSISLRLVSHRVTGWSGTGGVGDDNEENYHDNDGEDKNVQ